MSNTGSVHVAVAVGLALGASIVHAQKAVPDLGDMASASQLVVHSRVSRVEYRMSAPGAEGQPSVPNTIVTYEVMRSVRGAGPASITLRYAGGPDGRGHIYQPSNVPVFQVGDEDVLFVQNNGTNACPLTGCVDGRFRVLNGALYDGTGAPVQSVQNNRVVIGSGPSPAEFDKVSYPTPAFDELMKNPEARRLIQKTGMSMAEARNRYNAQAPRSIDLIARTASERGADSAGSGAGAGAGERSVEQQAATQPMSVGAFLAAVSAVPSSANEASKSFRSVDPNARIAAPTPQPASPQPALQSNAAPLRSPADVAEEQSIPPDDATITDKKSR